MSENYDPGPGVVPDSLYSTVLLSQRDLGLQVPINYVTTPGVSFSAACFPRLRYEDDNSADCLSNLLAVGFRRFEIDLYWDQWRQVWSFCPVTVPSSVPNADTGTRTTMDTSPSALSAVLSAEAPISSFPLSSLASTSSPPLSTGILARQATSTPSSSLETPSAQTSQTTASPTNSAETSLGQTLPSISILPNTSNEPLVSIGPYVCTTSITLSTFITQLLDYIQKTQNTIGAHLLYVDLNIHAAANSSSPTSPAPKPSGLPQPQDLLGSLFEANLSAYMYTPSNLMSERANINGSWYTVPEIHRPAQAFYITETNEYGIASTDDGWPSEGYIEFSKSKRLLLGFGTVDPQMSGYNFTGDDSTIFPRGYILDNQLDVDATDSGRVTNGCFLHNNTEDLSRVNSSWAIATTLSNFDYPTSPSADILPLLNLTTNLTNCGISPVLNVTLLNSTAHDNFVPYQNYSYATIWSWAPGEPKNASSGDGSDSLFRCASANVDLAGRWVVNDCSNKYYASCRAVNQPYNWTITSYPISYSYANQACPEGYNFAAPRTSLENSYLLQAMILSHRDFDGHGAWVDFNSLDTKGCWVSGGPNATCPYTESLGDHDYLYRKYVLVPTVAAIIVLVISGLTVFVKVAGNRKVRKRTRKRADNGFVYEGVPS